MTLKINLTSMLLNKFRRNKMNRGNKRLAF